MRVLDVCICVGVCISIRHNAHIPASWSRLGTDSWRRCHSQVEHAVPVPVHAENCLLGAECVLTCSDAAMSECCMRRLWLFPIERYVVGIELVATVATCSDAAMINMVYTVPAERCLPGAGPQEICSSPTTASGPAR